MTRPRKALVSLETTRYYHIISRCVRRAFLCGVDKVSGNNFEHRRKWIEARLHTLSSIFAIDICAYAVMSNHYHLVVRLSPEQLTNESAYEIARRWQYLFKGSLLLQRFCEGELLASVEREAVSAEIEVYRQRLCDLGWLMKCLNEPLARIANKEDQCKGHFWEHRYKSQALCSDEALLSCMAYVDLNPIRAAMADTPEDSDHTSVQHRLNTLQEKPTIDLAKAIAEQCNQGCLLKDDLPIKPLLKFNPDKVNRLARAGALGYKKALHNELPFSMNAYLELVDWTGRIMREDRRGSIKQSLPPILQRLNMDNKQWLVNATQFEWIHRKRFGNKPKIKSSA